MGQHPFYGIPHENPLNHIETLEEFVSSIHKHEGTEDYILCKLFKYYLAGLIGWSSYHQALSLPRKMSRLCFWLNFSMMQGLKSWGIEFGHSLKDLLKCSEALGINTKGTDCPHHRFSCWNFFQRYSFALYINAGWCKRRKHKTKTKKEAKRLIENLVYRNS